MKSAFAIERGGSTAAVSAIRNGCAHLEPEGAGRSDIKDVSEHRWCCSVLTSLLVSAKTLSRAAWELVADG